MSSKANTANQDLALSALAEFGDGSHGKFVSEEETEKGTLELRFESNARGYAGWHWVVTLSQPDKRRAASVSEINLLAGPEAQVAPEWVPWAERLREFRKQLRAEGKAKSDAEADAIIRRMASGSDGEVAEDAEGKTQDGGVEPPKKTRVRKRLVKRSEDTDGEQPDDVTDE